jgi:pyrimidine operon attenuation protein/uracil phosphoribosyltransferase
MKSQLILSNDEILRKITRLAFEVTERNFGEKEFVFAGIEGTGYILAEKTAAEMKKIYDCEIKIVKVSLDKSQPTQSEISLDADVSDFAGKYILLIDDVLNTGRTLAYSFKPFLKVPVKKLETLVLVDRGYHTFPVAAEYCGYSLSTTIMQHIRVEYKDEQWSVYLD